MKHRRLWVAAGVVAMVWASGSSAETRNEEGSARPGRVLPQPHILLKNINLDPLTAEDIITSRLNLTGDSRMRDLKTLFSNPAALKKITKGMLTEAQLRILDENSDKIQQLLQDSRSRDFLEDAIKTQKEGRQLDAEQIATLKRLVDSNFDPNSIEAPAGQGANRPEAQGQEGARTQGQGHSGTRGADQTDDNSAPQEQQQSWFERQMARISSAIAEEMNNPANAGAFQNALRSLGGIKEGSDGEEQFDFGGLWKSATADAAGWVASRAEWPGVLAAAPREFYRDLQAALPEISGSVSGALAKVPTDKLGGGGAAGGLPVQQIAWVVAAVAMITIVWQGVGKKVAARVAPRGFRLGPWPVQPHSVADRDDLVAAFEYLALLRLGAVARTTNHRAVAARLQADEPDAERRDAAGTLARIYERLRYEPHPVPLAENELAAARKNLSMLARATAA
jgi:hypothetical protein